MVATTNTWGSPLMRTAWWVLLYSVNPANALTVRRKRETMDSERRDSASVHGSVMTSRDSGRHWDPLSTRHALNTTHTLYGLDR